jgi:hypothetical protein
LLLKLLLLVEVIGSEQELDLKINPVDEFKLAELLLFEGDVGVVEAFVEWLAIADAPLYGINNDEIGEIACPNSGDIKEGVVEEADDKDDVYEGDEFDRHIILHDGDDGGSELLLMLLFDDEAFLKSKVVNEFLLSFSLVLFSAIDSKAGK